MTELRRRNFAVPLGCLLVALGVALSAAALESTIFPAGTFVGTTRRAPALMLGRIFLAGAGAYFLIKRPRVTTVHLSAFVLGTVAAVMMGAVLLQVGYAPPRIVSGWKAFSPKNEQNELGFRGRPIWYSPGDAVVLLLGDSQVEASALTYGGMPERLLEADLDTPDRKTRVFSLGAGGYGTDQELLALQEYLERYRADLVVLWQTPGNDIWNNVFKTHMYSHTPKPTFWLDGSGQLCGPDEFLNQPIASSPIVLAALWQRSFGLPWRDKSWERHLPPAYVPLDHFEGPVRSEWQERWNTNLGRMRDEELATEKSHMAVMLSPRSPRMQYGLNLTRALTARIRDLVTAHHGKLVVFHTDTHDFVSEDDQMYVLNDKYYRVSKKQYDANWAYVNSGFDAEVIPVTAKDWRVGPEDGHLNAQANKQVIADLARRLQSRIVER